jgi:hypothetical protein
MLTGARIIRKQDKMYADVAEFQSNLETVYRDLRKHECTMSLC